MASVTSLGRRRFACTCCYRECCKRSGLEIPLLDKPGQQEAGLRWSFVCFFDFYIWCTACTSLHRGGVWSAIMKYHIGAKDRAESGSFGRVWLPSY